MMNFFNTVLETLRERGWCKCVRHNFSGQSCLLGGFEDSKESRAEDFPKELDILADVILKSGYSRSPTYCESLASKTYSNCSIIANFNNHPDTTFEMVTMVLEKAAARVDSL